MKAPIGTQIGCTRFAVNVCARVARDYGCAAHDILGDRRFKSVAEARQVAMFICLGAGFGLSEVGRAFGRDHTTVIHARRAIANNRVLRSYAIVAAMEIAA